MNECVFCLSSIELILEMESEARFDISGNPDIMSEEIISINITNAQCSCGASYEVTNNSADYPGFKKVSQKDVWVYPRRVFVGNKKMKAEIDYDTKYLNLYIFAGEEWVHSYYYTPIPSSSPNKDDIDILIRIVDNYCENGDSFELAIKKTLEVKG